MNMGTMAGVHTEMMDNCGVVGCVAALPLSSSSTNRITVDLT